MRTGRRKLRALVSKGELDLVTVAAPSAVDALLEALPPEQHADCPWRASAP